MGYRCVDLADGKIYAIVDIRTGKIVYIGSTAQRYLPHRMKGHASKSRSDNPEMAIAAHMKAEGLQHFEIRLLENFPCKTKKELTAREMKLVAQHKPMCNGHGMKKNKNHGIKHDTELCPCGERVSTFPGPKSRHWATAKHEPLLHIKFLFD